VTPQTHLKEKPAGVQHILVLEVCVRQQFVSVEVQSKMSASYVFNKWLVYVVTVAVSNLLSLTVYCLLLISQLQCTVRIHFAVCYFMGPVWAMGILHP